MVGASVSTTSADAISLSTSFLARPRRNLGSDEVLGDELSGREVLRPDEDGRGDESLPALVRARVGRFTLVTVCSEEVLFAALRPTGLGSDMVSSELGDWTGDGIAFKLSKDWRCILTIAVTPA